MLTSWSAGLSRAKKLVSEDQGAKRLGVSRAKKLISRGSVVPKSWSAWGSGRLSGTKKSGGPKSGAVLVSEAVRVSGPKSL